MPQWADRSLYIQGGVGAPVGLTVFKTAGGSLGAIPGGFDSHTPLPIFVDSVICAVYCKRGINVNSILSVEKVRLSVRGYLFQTWNKLLSIIPL